MMKHLLTIVLCLTTLTGLAQEEKIKKSEWWNGNPSYAVPIREVNVTARRPMKEIGIQKTQLDTTILHENIALSMADILTFNTSIFVKQYGRATLSTVAFRGTSPSHTQVTWNGMRINSPMLGMTDFSMIPSYFIDDASLLHGTSSVNEAGGGLGGAVKLSTRPADADGFNLQYTQGVGSFSTFDEFLRLTYGNDRWQTSTRVVYSSSPNDFKYRNYDKKRAYPGRRPQHHRLLLPDRTQQKRCIPRFPRVAGSLLQYRTRRPVSDCRPGMSIRSGDFRCCRSITRRTTTT